MYVQPAFRIIRERALGLLRERAFGAFVVPTGGALSAVHVPFLTFEQDDGSLRIELHVARANPIHTLVGEGCPALLICTGPDAYISPDWYGVPNEVPTWTYTAVHLTGTARLLPQSENRAHVDRMVAYFEQQLPGKTPWTADRVDPNKVASMMQAIVSVEMRVESTPSATQSDSAQGRVAPPWRHRRPAFAAQCATRTASPTSCKRRLMKKASANEGTTRG